MFSFLNRNKGTTPQNGSLDDDKTQTAVQNNGNHNDNDKNTKLNNQLQASIDDAKKNLYESIVYKRTDIVVSIINEWFRGIFWIFDHFLNMKLKSL